jgi:hypothetical protein
MRSSEGQTVDTTQARHRIVDWVQVITVPVELLGVLICTVLLLPIIIAWIKPPTTVGLFILIILPGGVLVGLICAIYAQLAGIMFDPAKDLLVIPAYSIRRRIRISEIRDANSEFAPRGTFFGAAMAAVARATNDGKTAKPQKLYIVNLSGTFGSRQARFMSKKRRDQFLSDLRQYAPHVKITRFAAWS